MSKPYVIKYEGDNTRLFEKISVDCLDYDARIIVPETHNAIIIKDGQMMNTLESGDHPIFDALLGKKYGSRTVDIIFMSKTARLKLLWGTKTRFTFRDPYTDMPYCAGANGEFEIQIGDPRKAYLRLFGSDKNFTVENLKERLSGRMVAAAEPIMARYINEQNCEYFRLTEMKDRLAAEVYPVIAAMFGDDYGIKLFSFTIAEIAAGEEYAAEIEAERKRRRERAEKRADSEDEEKRQMLREDRDWERQKYIMDMKNAQNDKYLDVTREIGWEKSASGGTFCSGCGTKCTPSDRFCPNCGKSLVPTAAVCPECGFTNAAGARFCSQCGHKF